MKKQLRRRLALVAIAVALPIFMLFGFVVLFSGGKAVAAACGSTDPMTPAVQVSKAVQLTGEQVGNAKIIIGVGQGLGASARDAKLAVWVAYHESALRNLNFGDSDSLGLFQQRPSQRFWGTAEQILNPVHASTRFYEALFLVPNRDSLSNLDEALAVQHASRKAYLSPNHNFLSWEPIVDALMGKVGIDLPDVATVQTAAADAAGAEGFDTICSSTSDTGVPGKVIIAPGANYPGRPVAQETLDYIAQVAGIYGQPLICTTGTHHSYLSKSGLVSDHASGHACDIGMVANGGTDNGPVGDAIAKACLLAAGDPEIVADQEVATGGLFTKENNGLRIQCIWKTDQGGNHHNHVHIGARPLSAVA